MRALYTNQQNVSKVLRKSKRSQSAFVGNGCFTALHSEHSPFQAASRHMPSVFSGTAPFPIFVKKILFKRTEQAPLCFEQETAHGNIQDQPDQGKIDDRGTAAVADEREGDADHRHDPHYHAGVDKDLPKEVNENPRREVAPEPILGPPHRLENTQ